MNFLQNQPLQEAAMMGGELGNTLGGIMYKQPMERAQMLMQLAQLQQAARYHQGLMGIQQQRVEDMNQWHEGELNNKQNALQMQQQQNAILDAIRQLNATNRGNYWQGELQVQNDRNSINQNLGDRRLDISQERVDQGQQRLEQPKNFGNNGVYYPQPVQQGTNTLQGVVSQQQHPANPNAAMANQLNLLKLQAGVGGTNMFPQILQRLQGLQQGLQQPAPPAAAQWNWDPTNGLQRLGQ